MVKNMTKSLNKSPIRILLVAFLIFFLPAKLASAATLEDQLNHLIGPKQQYDTKLSPVYLQTNATEESISPQSGQLTIAQTDFVLPGRNGLDLEFKRIYKSGISNVQNMNVRYLNGAWVDYVESNAETSSFNEDRYNLGVGMGFSFPQMEIKKNDDGTSFKFLHTESGDIYTLSYEKVDGDYVYVPEGQTVKDVYVKETAEYSNGQSDGTSKYVMVGKDGKKSYFAEDGRLLGIRDRYGNTINFEYSVLTYSIDGKTISKKLMSRITDSVGRTVDLEYKEDHSFLVTPITNAQYGKDESWKASQNPNNTDSGDLQGKFQVILHLPGNKTIVYDKSAVLVNSAKQVIRTRLQRVIDVDNKPKYHFWYEQPDLGFTYMNGNTYAVFNRYENLVQIDYARTNRIVRYTYNTFTKTLNQGSMQYRKIFEKKELAKTGYDAAQTNFLDKFVTNEVSKTNYAYGNEPDGYGFAGYKGYDNAYLGDTYRYTSSVTDAKGNTTQYTYDGLHQLLLTEEKGSEHHEVYRTEHDEMKLVKKRETLSYQVENGQDIGTPLRKVENFRYDEYGNMTNYTGPEAKRDENGNPVDNEHTVIYSYAYNKFHVLTLKSWKQDAKTTNQIAYEVDNLGNVTKETKTNGAKQDDWVVTDYKYDSYGNVTSKAMTAGGTTSQTFYEYAQDANGVDVKGAYLTKQFTTVNGAAAATAYGYDWNTGDRTVEIDPNGNKTVYKFDAFSRLVQTTAADGSLVSYSYNETPYTNQSIHYTDAVKNEFAYEYDTLGRLSAASAKVDGAWRVLNSINYDKLGNKIKEMDANGNSTRYEYDSANRLIRKTLYEKDTVNKGATQIAYRIGYDAETPLLVTQTDAEGNIRKTFFDILERMTKLELSPDGKSSVTTTYSYDYEGNLLAEKDPRGNETSYSYDSLDRQVLRKDALGNETEYSYNVWGKIARQTEPGGKITESLYNALGLEVQRKVYQSGSADYTYESHDYDLAGNLRRTKRGSVVSAKDAVSSDSSFAYDAMNRMTDEYKRMDATRTGHTEYEYDANGNRSKMIQLGDAAGAKSRTYAYAYDYAGRLIEESGKYQESDGHGGFTEYGHYHNLFSYDDAGNRIRGSIDNGSGLDVTEYAYNYMNLVISTKVSLDKARMKETRIQYDKVGNKVSETIIVGGISLTTTFVYDGLGRMTKQIDPLGNTTRYLYDANGNEIKEIDARYLSMTDSEAPGVEAEYDVLNRLVKTVAFDGKNREVTSYRVYDARGNVVLEADGVGYNADHPEQSIGTKYRYDANDRKIAELSAQTTAWNDENHSDAVSHSYTYDNEGHVLTDTDVFGKTTQYVYYLNGMLKEVTYPDKVTEYYDYDLSGYMMTVYKDRMGRTTKTWNGIFDKPYRIENPDGSVASYSYSPKGDLIEQIDPLGYVTRYEYDASGNQTAMMEQIGSDSDYTSFKRTETVYDEADRKLSAETILVREPKRSGLAEEKVSSGDKVTFAYDKAGHLTMQSGLFGHQVSYAYDAVGNVLTKQTKVDDGSSDVERYEYDTRSHMIASSLLVRTGELSPESLAGAKFDNEFGDRVYSTTRFAYDANGNMVKRTNPNGGETVFEHNYDGQLVKTTNPVMAATENIYDLKGRLVRQVKANGAVEQYDYDALDRLIRKHEPAADGGEAVTRYVYDAAGNLIREIAPNQYDASKDTSDSVASLPGTRYEYDAMNRRTATFSPDGKGVLYILYDAAGRVVKQADGLGYTGDMASSQGTTNGYDGLGRIVSQTDSLGNRSTYGYDVLGNVTIRNDALGNKTLFSYNPDSTLARTTSADGGVVSYAYDKLGRMTAQTDALGAVTTYKYNAFGQVKLVTDPYGYAIETKVDLSGKSATVKDKRGSVTTFKYDATGRLAEKRSPLERDASGSVVYAVDAYQYDAVDNVIKWSLTHSKDRAFLRETTYTYALDGSVITVSDNSGAYTKNGYDKNGNLILAEKARNAAKSDIVQYEYDEENRLVKQIKLVEEEALDSVSLSGSSELRDDAYPGMIRLITSYEYDQQGNMIKAIDPRAYLFAGSDTANRNKYTTTYSYDVLSRLIKTSRWEDGATVNEKYAYDARGNRLSVTNTRGYTTSYQYDGMNRVVSVTDAEGLTERNQYDLAGNRTAVTDKRGHETTYQYDKLNRQVAVKDAAGTVTTRNVYDADGHVVKKIDAKGYLAADSDDARYGTLYEYDLAGRLTASTDAEGGRTVYRYNAANEKTSERNALGQSYVYKYDNAGRLAAVTDPLGITTSYSYDLAGNVLDMTDGRGKVTHNRFAAFGLLIEEVNALDKPLKYRYDLAQNVTELTDRNNHRTTYTYDNRNRLLEKQVAETGDRISYTYDAASNRTTMTDGSGKSEYTYDGNNRLIQITKNGTVQLAYGYDAAGNIVSATDKKGYSTTYGYDVLNRLDAVTANGKTTRYSYDTNGNRASIAYANGMKEIYSYNKNNLLVTLQNKRADGKSISAYAYTYDAAGRQTSKTDSYGTTDYTYDADGRITQVDAPGKTTAYAYDAAGNRQSELETYESEQPSGYNDPGTGKDIAYLVKQSQYVYTANNELVKLVETMFSSDGKQVLEKTTAYVYDGNGNELRQQVSYIRPHKKGMGESNGADPYGDKIGGDIDTLIERVSNTFDGFNRLVRAERVKGGKRNTVEYTYDGDGLRTQKLSRSSADGYKTVVTNYLWDRGAVIQETDGSNKVTVQYTRGLNYVSRTDSTGQTLYYLYNGHGDVVQTVTEEGEVVNQYDYDVFGNPTLTIEAYSESIRYAGEFYDAEVGLYYLKARYYDPYIGRFISQDSYRGENRNPLSLNLYTYCFNNPITYVDPTGHAAGSVVDYLKSQGKDSSFSSREKIAQNLGIKNYTGTSAQNTQMLNMLTTSKTSTTTSSTSTNNTKTSSTTTSSTSTNTTKTSSTTASSTATNTTKTSSTTTSSTSTNTTKTSSTTTSSTTTNTTKTNSTSTSSTTTNSSKTTTSTTSSTKVVTGSVVEYLNSQGKDSSFTAREKLAKDLGIKNYTGTAAQNTQMLNMLSNGSKTTTASNSSTGSKTGSSSSAGNSGKTSGSSNSQGTGNTNLSELERFCEQPITSTWGISNSTAEAWFLKQKTAQPVIKRYGLNSTNIGDVTAALEAAGVSPVFFYAYTVNEGGGAGGFINHYGKSYYSNHGGDTAVNAASGDAQYLASQSKNMNSQPAWIDLGNYVDFVPQSVKNSGNASFANMPSGSIGRAYIAATAATTWEVYYPNGLLKKYNTVQNYGAPMQGVMKSIKAMGDNP
ncbi:RHS repeat-associated core domain-containing protein [Gorillibacterium massiliense]|uniref:RHS repeat-associated core domain-containing protein n=1 Tax=Gorillibacterium massiliense TaxID=1280390 RepID=UPI0004B578E6|nr:RHS repeat-associated core domain-containing protein [Gorillibacterium massiliense]